MTKMKDEQYRKAISDLVDIVDTYHPDCVVKLVESHTPKGVCPQLLGRAYEVHMQINTVLDTVERLDRVKALMADSDPEIITFGRQKRA